MAIQSQCTPNKIFSLPTLPMDRIQYESETTVLSENAIPTTYSGNMNQPVDYQHYFSWKKSCEHEWRKHSHLQKMWSSMLKLIQGKLITEKKGKIIRTDSPIIAALREKRNNKPWKKKENRCERKKVKFSIILKLNKNKEESKMIRQRRLWLFLYCMF